MPSEDRTNVGRVSAWIDGRPLRGVLLLALFLACVVTAWNATWRAEWDSATYLLTARSIAAGDGYVYAGEPFFLRPPGLSWLLIPFLGEGPAPDLRAVHLMLGAFATVSAVALYYALRPRGRRFALAVTVLAASTPLMVERWNWVQSEFPFLATFFGGIALLERAFRSEKRWWLPALGGALLLAASYYVRSVGLMLVPGIVLLPMLFRPRKRWRGLLPAAVFLALIAPWMVHAKGAAAEVTRPPDQLLLFDYNTALLHTDPGRPESARVGWPVLRERMFGNVPKVAADIGPSVLFSDHSAALWVLGLLALLGWLVAVVRGPGLLEWFGLAYAGLLALYFDHHERLSAPLTIFVLLYVAQALVTLAKAPVGPARVRTGLLAVLFAVAAIGNAVRLPASFDLEGQQAQSATGQGLSTATRGDLWSRIDTMGAWLRDNTPEDAVVLCHSAPVFRWLSGRECYTYRFPRGRDLFEKYAPDLVLWDGPPPPYLPNMAQRHTRAHELISVGDWQTPVFWLKPIGAGR